MIRSLNFVFFKRGCRWKGDESLVRELYWENGMELNINNSLSQHCSPELTPHNCFWKAGHAYLSAGLTHHGSQSEGQPMFPEESSNHAWKVLQSEEAACDLLGSQRPSEEDCFMKNKSSFLSPFEGFLRPSETAPLDLWSLLGDHWGCQPHPWVSLSAKVLGIEPLQILN